MSQRLFSWVVVGQLKIMMLLVNSTINFATEVVGTKIYIFYFCKKVF